MGTFLEGLGEQAASNAISSIQNIFSNALGLTMSQSDAMERQFKYNNMLMNIQNKYQKEAAAQSQQYAKNYWDYTNAENQKKHIKNAGLNPALMYGMSGSGGMGATGGAKQESPAQPQGNPIAMGLQVQALEQQKRMQDAEIAKTLAEARKADVEADKTEGVDTEKALTEIKKMLSDIDLNVQKGNWYEADTDYKIALKSYTKELENLTIKQAETEEQKKALVYEQMMTQKEMQEKIAKEWEVLNEEAKERRVKNYILEETKEETIRQVSLQNALLVSKIALTNAETETQRKTVSLMNAEISELMTRAWKNKYDAMTYRKEVVAMIKRWGEQTFNERWHLTNESAEVIVDGIAEFMPWTSAKKVVKSVKDGVMTSTETTTKSRK